MNFIWSDYLSWFVFIFLFVLLLVDNDIFSINSLLWINVYSKYIQTQLLIGNMSRVGKPFQQIWCNVVLSDSDDDDDFITPRKIKSIIDAGTVKKIHKFILITWGQRELTK